MPSTTAVALAVCLGLAAPLFDQQIPRDPSKPLAPATATVTGHVTTGDPLHALPISRARVTLEPAGNTAGQVTDADADGAFLFRNVSPGAYRIRADRAGFVWIGAHGAFEKPPIVDVAAGTVVSANVSLAPGAAIEGTVINERGAPAANLVVAAVRLTFGPYGKQPTSIREARTDDLGRFRVHSLPPGDYLVQAAPDALDLLARPPAAEGERPVGLARTYYRGTPRVQDAEFVTLQIGQEIANLDFTVTSVPLAAVDGRVVDASGSKPPSFSVRLQGVGSPPGQIRGYTVLSDNRFRFPSVPPGQYWLIATAKPAPERATQYAAVRVDVSGQDAADFTLTTRRGAALDGRVEIHGGGVPIPAGLQVVAHETAFELPAPQPGGAPAPAAMSTAVVGPDGAFAFDGLFGPRTLRVTHLPDGWALDSVWLDKDEITDLATDFRESEAPRHLRVVLAPKAGAVGGRVTTAAGQPAARARVVVFADDPTRWGIQSRFIKTVEASASGSFSVVGLLPGRYAIAAVTFLEDNSWADPSVLDRLRPGAAPLVVTGAEHLSVALTSLDLSRVR